jgi:hypothetical protein
LLPSYSRSSENEGVVALLGSQSSNSNINTSLPFHNDSKVVNQQAEPNFPPAVSSPAEAPLVTLTEKELEQIAKLRLQNAIKPIPHADLFDLEHWNTYWPDLPRMVSCDPDIHTDYDCSTGKWIGGEGPTSWNATHPINLSWKIYAPHRLMGRYSGYSKGKGKFAKPDFPNKVDLLMKTGALRPHPDLQTIIDKMVRRLGGSDGNHSTSGTSTGTNTPYMTLHARVEPEMIRHFSCKPIKENNLTKIFEMVEATFPDPPATKMFLPINRQNMESEGRPHPKNPNPNPLFVENLAALNQAVQNGLWGGRVQVFEFGSNALQGTKFAHRPSTTGAILNYYIALGGNVFIGTEISSYSNDLLSTRFYRGNRENYKYLPSGLEKWPADGATRPPGFKC